MKIICFLFWHYKIKHYLCINKKEIKQKLKTYIMKAVPTQKQVLDYMISKGNNENEARKMINKNYDYAITQYSTIKRISECIVTIY